MKQKLGSLIFLLRQLRIIYPSQLFCKWKFLLKPTVLRSWRTKLGEQPWCGWRAWWRSGRRSYTWCSWWRSSSAVCPDSGSTLSAETFCWSWWRPWLTSSWRRRRFRGGFRFWFVFPEGVTVSKSASPWSGPKQVSELQAEAKGKVSGFDSGSLEQSAWRWSTLTDWTRCGPSWRGSLEFLDWLWEPFLWRRHQPKRTPSILRGLQCRRRRRQAPGTLELLLAYEPATDDDWDQLGSGKTFDTAHNWMSFWTRGRSWCVSGKTTWSGRPPNKSRTSGWRQNFRSPQSSSQRLFASAGLGWTSSSRNLGASSIGGLPGRTGFVLPSCRSRKISETFSGKLPLGFHFTTDLLMTVNRRQWREVINWGVGRAVNCMIKEFLASLDAGMKTSVLIKCRYTFSRPALRIINHQCQINIFIVIIENEMQQPGWESK